MSNTNMVLGSWRRGEWPEYVTVSHDGMREPGRRYVPERTCRDVGGLDKFVCSECGASLYMLGMYDDPTYWVDDVAAVLEYCPNCGAKVVDE